MPPLIIRTSGFEDFLDPSGGAYIKALIMGEAGVGKTPSACSWPKPILADCENGRMSVASMGVPYADIRNSADMEALLDHLRRECLKPVDKRAHQTLVIDTVDSYQTKLIHERLQSERKESLSGWADWGWLDGKMTQLIERALNLPMNVVVNLHVKDVTDDDGDSTRLVQKARLKGDVKDSIFQSFDLIGRMEQSYAVAADGDQKGERVRVRQIRWHAEPKFPNLRDRSNKLPRFTEVDFTAGDFQRIFDAITSGLDDLPKSTEVESLEVEGDGEVPTATAEGGPVEAPKIPQLPRSSVKKATATPAKKAPAKKAAATPSGTKVVDGETVDTETGEIKDPDPWQPPVGTEAAAGEVVDRETGTDVDEAAVALVEDVLGGEVVVEDSPVDAGVEAQSGEPAVATGSPDKPPKHCGDQPESMVGKHTPVEGCGAELNADNAGKAQISMIKFKTYLCDADFQAQQGKAS